MFFSVTLRLLRLAQDRSVVKTRLRTETPPRQRQNCNTPQWRGMLPPRRPSWQRFPDHRQRRQHRLPSAVQYALNQLEDSPVEAENLRQQAQGVVEYIAAHISAEHADLRRSFLGLPDVRAI